MLVFFLSAFKGSFPTIFTPQGDGNESLAVLQAFKPDSYSRQYLPRKGTETIQHLYQLVIINYIPDNIYPARGRKPARLASCAAFASSFPTIFTPQGDGNEVGYQDTMSNGYDSRQYLPRKGTETLEGNNQEKIDILIPDNIYPARGRKQSYLKYHPCV